MRSRMRFPSPRSSSRQRRGAFMPCWLRGRRARVDHAHEARSMKPRPFDYIRPDTVEEAIALLAEYGEAARVLAGGQSLVPMLNLRLIEADALIDISQIAALDVISDRGDKIEIG